MKDHQKTKSQLVQELEEMRRRVAELEQSEAEKSFPKAESLVRSMIEHSPIEFWACDRQGCCFLQSKASLQQWGDLRGKPFDASGVPPETMERWESNNKRVLEGAVVYGEVTLVVRSGQRREFLEVVAPIVDAGKIDGILGVVIDITEQKRTLRALEESEATARALLNASTESLLLVGLDWRILTLNDEAAARFGGTVDEIIGRHVADFFPPDVAASRKLLAEEAVRTRRSVSYEDRRNGRDYHACHYPVFDADGNVAGFAVYAQDITERKTAEEAIRREQRRLRRLLDMNERDRKLVAYEIHDALSQPLAAALMQLEAALKDRQPEEVPDGCQQGMDLLRQSISATRRLINWERPIILDEQGLLDAIEHLVSGVRENGGPEIAWSHDVRFDRLVPPLETAVYRIIQESVANAQEHSQSDRVRIRLVQQNNLIRIEIEDWGIGFDVDQVEPNRFGLEGIRQRARLFGGHAGMDSSPGKGTRVVVELPVVEGAAKEAEEFAN